MACFGSSTTNSFASRHPSAYIAESLENLGEEHVKSILSTGKTERFDNLSGPKRIVRSALIDSAPSSVLVVPIRAGHRIIAVVEIAGEKLEETPDLASAFERVGLALDNAIAADRVKSPQHRARFRQRRATCPNGRIACAR